MDTRLPKQLQDFYSRVDNLTAKKVAGRVRSLPEYVTSHMADEFPEDKPVVGQLISFSGTKTTDRQGTEMRSVIDRLEGMIDEGARAIADKKEALPAKGQTALQKDARKAQADLKGVVARAVSRAAGKAGLPASESSEYDEIAQLIADELVADGIV